MLAYYRLGSIALAALSAELGRSVVRLSVRGVRFRWPLFRDILRVGLVAALVTVATNLTIAIATGYVGRFGPAAIAGLRHRLAARVPAGAARVRARRAAGGDGRHQHRRRPARPRAARGLDRRRHRRRRSTESIGLAAAAFPRAWLRLFDTDPAMLDAGARYLRAVGPFYGLFGLGMALYFASQGAGRLLWPLLANLTRLAIAAGGGWLVLRGSGDLSHVFLALSVALAAFGLINAGAVAGGAWFGPIRWPRARPAILPPASRPHWSRSPGVEYPRVP